MFTSHIMFYYYSTNSFLQPDKDGFVLTKLAGFDYDLGLNIGELIKISNMETAYLLIIEPIEVIVKSKTKILIDYEWVIEYVVVFKNNYDLHNYFPVIDKTFVSSDSDLFLITLVELADKKLFESMITLLVKGTVVSGFLISETTYFEGVKRKVSDNHILVPDNISTDKFLESFKFSKNTTDGSKQQNKLINQKFIHLKGAQILLGGFYITSQNNGYWRGQLSCIDGFWLEPLTSSVQPPDF